LPGNCIIETHRLKLFRFQPEEALYFYTLNLDKEVLKFTGDKPFADLKAAKDFIKCYTHYDIHGFGRWSVYNKLNGSWLGWCGLKQHNTDMVDLGFRFLRSEWFKGYATEAATACLNYGFNTLDLPVIIARVASQNEKSLAVIKKLNMPFWKKDVCDGLQNAHFFKKTKAEYRCSLAQ